MWSLVILHGANTGDWVVLWVLSAIISYSYAIIIYQKLVLTKNSAVDVMLLNLVPDPYEPCPPELTPAQQARLRKICG